MNQGRWTQYGGRRDVRGRRTGFFHVDWGRHTRERLAGWGFNASNEAEAVKPFVYTGWSMASHGWSRASHAYVAANGRLTAPGVPGYMTFTDIFDPEWPTHYRAGPSGNGGGLSVGGWLQAGRIE